MVQLLTDLIMALGSLSLFFTSTVFLSFGLLPHDLRMVATVAALCPNSKAGSKRFSS